VLGLDPEEIEPIYVKRVILEGFGVLCTASGGLGGANTSIRSKLATLQQRCLQLEQTAEKNQNAASRRSDAASYKGKLTPLHGRTLNKRRGV
jgi:hypothetical protein